MALDVKELCRLCGKKEEFYKDLKDEDNKNILKMIQEFIQIPFAEHDELPTKVCLNCEEKIESFQLFIVECYNVQETLRQMCLETCEKYPIKLEYDIEIDCNNSAIKSEVKHELSAEDLVNANNSEECMTGVDADDYNNDGDDNVTLATLKDLKQEKTSERRRMTLTETGMEHLKEISDLNTGDFIEFKTRVNLREHQAVTHDDKCRCVCAHCDKVFKQRKSLKEHMYTHTGDKPLACEWCDVRCSHPSSLRKHKWLHHRDKMARTSPHQRFTARGSVAKHRRVVHDKVKPHVCDECGHACVSASKLLVHRATAHSDDRPFACHMCDKRFKTRAILRGHQATHDDKRRYACSHCDKAFRQRHSLKEHMRSHTGDKPLTCEWCDVRCSRRSVLRKHQRRHHPDKMASEGYLKDDADPSKTDVEAI